ncbi:hypothetical protein Fcan01_10257 [Folsomia candida]|uniref:Uncharacterized protein n=1 Tax=Folsomia candida TaxID=158441 RepID=A0A226EA40_FOLCA|nr:hypothetical protein Fcan01_10257 [Folsomia candida]
MSSKYKSKSNEDMEKEDTNLVSLPTLMKTLNIANSVQTGKNIFNFMSPLETLQKQCLDGKAKLVEDGLKSLSENEIFKDLCGKAGYENLEAIAKNPSEFVSKHGCTLVHKELSKVQLHVANQAYKAELVKTAFNLTWSTEVDQYITEQEDMPVSFGKCRNNSPQQKLVDKGLQLKLRYQDISQEICKGQVECAARAGITRFATGTSFLSTTWGTALSVVTVVLGVGAAAAQYWTSCKAGERLEEIEKLLGRICAMEDKLEAAYKSLDSALKKIHPDS